MFIIKVLQYYETKFILQCQIPIETLICSTPTTKQIFRTASYLIDKRDKTTWKLEIVIIFDILHI